MISESDRTFRERVEACDWNEPFTHEHHIRLAWIYLQEFELTQATGRCRAALRGLAESHGDFDKYHDTLTVAFMQLIARHRAAAAPGESWPQFRLRARPLFESGRRLIGRHYSDERLAHPDARHGFVPPDREPF
ncbi:MAG: hypothetical protein KJO54_09135 [Gammaproteobacteria bacterium]|nr:hypothetical protein [Gammaproteobacteria bacterium]NNM21438.1 hypothetical protein [Gammaproteobacteria bacterium]